MNRGTTCANFSAAASRSRGDGPLERICDSADDGSLHDLLERHTVVQPVDFLTHLAKKQ